MLTYVEFLQQAIEQNYIHPYHKPTIEDMLSDLDRVTSLSEMFILHGYLTEEQYCTLANKLYKTINPDALDLRTMEYIQSNKAPLMTGIPTQYIESLLAYNVVAYKIDMHLSKAYFILKEPNHITQEPSFNKEIEKDIYIDLNQINALVLDFIKMINIHSYEIIMVSACTFKDIVNEYTLSNQVPIPTKFLKYQLDGKHFVRKIVVDGLVMKASDIQMWAVNLGGRTEINWSYTVLGTYVGEHKRKCTVAFLKQAQPEVYRWFNYSYDDVLTKKVIDADINNLGKLEQFRGRINLLPDENLDTIAIRVIPQTTSVIPFSELQISPNIKAKLIDIISYNSSGIICLAGEPGSGKSTLLRSLLLKIRELRPADRIESIEAPVEAILDGICQINLGGGTFNDTASVLQALTRRATRIVNANEINTTEMMELTITCAVMSMLTITTIHTESISAMADRIKGFAKGDKYTTRQFLNNSRAYLHLTMLKETCPNCLQQVTKEHPAITTDLIDVFTDYGYHEETFPLSVPQPNCPHCNGTGILMYKPIICIELLKIDNKFINKLSRSSDYELRELLHQTMMKNGTTGVHDAIQYMKLNKLDVLQVYKRFSLTNAVGENLFKEKLSVEDLQRSNL